MRWRKADREQEYAALVIDVRERLAPYVDQDDSDDDIDLRERLAPYVAADSGDDEDEPSQAVEPVTVLQAGPVGPYRPRHLAPR
jgi:hypothetical protein